MTERQLDSWPREDREGTAEDLFCRKVFFRFGEHRLCLFLSPNPRQTTELSTFRVLPNWALFHVCTPVIHRSLVSLRC